MPGKCCTTGNHGDTRPCYLCHHGNMIPPNNGCIKYTPIQVPARYSSMCYCMLCRQRSAQMACNCHSCLSLRFEQTAASMLGPSEKNITVNPRICCGGMGCERTEHVKYEFCQCAQCMDRVSREPRYHHNNVHLIHRHERAKIHVIQDNIKDQNNNESKNEEEHESDTKTSKSDISNGHKSPDAEVKTDENHNHHNLWTVTSNKRKRKHEESEQALLISKVIKTEKPGTEETPCENSSLAENVKDEEEEEEINSSPEKQNEEDMEYIGKGKEDRLEDHEDKVCVIESVMNSCHKNGFDLDNKKETPEDISLNKNHQHHATNSRGRGRRHYNTRHTTTKSHSYEADFEVPATSEWKEDKQLYSEITKSRQRSKLNRLLANEHERRRVAQLNSAYQDLRQLIPGYQCDTKLPKIKILRYAINYIAHLDNILEDDSDK